MPPLLAVEDKPRCNRCLRILPENATRCDHCGLSTNPAEAILEMKDADELRERLNLQGEEIAVMKATLQEILENNVLKKQSKSVIFLNDPDPYA